MSLAAHEHEHEGQAGTAAGGQPTIAAVEPDREELIGAPERQDLDPEFEPKPVHVYRNGVVAGVLGVAAAVVALAWLRRALATGGALDWVLVLATAAVAVVWLISCVDARTPLLVADRHGVRFRLGRAWRGLPWSEIVQVRHLAREGLRDGRLVVVSRDEEALVAGLTGRSARAARVSTRLYGAPLALPLGLTTRTTSTDLGADLEALAQGAVAVQLPEPAAVAGPDEAVEDRAADPAAVLDVDALSETPVHVSAEAAVDTPAETAAELPAHDTLSRDEGLAHEDPAHEVADEPALELPRESGEQPDEESVQEAPHRRMRDPRPQLAALITRASSWFERPRADIDDSATDEGIADDAVPLAAPTVEASATPEPVRAARPASRAEVRREQDQPALTVRTAIDAPEPDDDEPLAAYAEAQDTDRGLSEAWGDRVLPIAREGHPVEPLVIEDFVVEPAPDPVIGPELRAARTRLGLSTDQLAERTRIRPHVIEAIEVDDFVPCGGDFYARGHLRTMCRILGVDATDVISHFDERYAHAPLDPRRVFEAELATGSHGSIRSMRGGPNWSILIAAVMALILLWSVARLVMDAPPALRADTPVLNGSGGPHAGASTVADPVPVSITAADVGARVVVRDATGKVVFKGNLAIGEGTTVRASPPVRVQSTDGAVSVSVDGQTARPIGESGTAGQGTFTLR